MWIQTPVQNGPPTEDRGIKTAFDATGSYSRLVRSCKRARS